MRTLESFIRTNVPATDGNRKAFRARLDVKGWHVWVGPADERHQYVGYCTDSLEILAMLYATRDSDKVYAFGNVLQIITRGGAA